MQSITKCFQTWIISLISIGAVQCGDFAAASSATIDESMISAKRLYAPPADIENAIVTLPSPRECAAISSWAMLFSPRTERASFEFRTGAENVQIAPLAIDACKWALWIDDGEGFRLLVGGAKTKGEPIRGVWRTTEQIVTQEIFGCEEPTRLIDLVTTSGIVQIDAVMPAKKQDVALGENGAQEIGLLIDDSSNVVLAVYPTQWVNRVGEDFDVLIEARMPLDPAANPLKDSSLAQRTWAGAPLDCVLRGSSVRWSDGTLGVAHVTLEKSGVIRLRILDAHVGDATVRIDADVTDANGVVWTRSVATIVHICDGMTTLRDEPYATLELDGTWINVALPVSTQEPVLFAATELWAHSPRGDRCLGWIGGIAQVEIGRSGQQVLQIGCEPGRLKLAANELIECRNIRIHEREGFAPLDLVAQSQIDTAEIVQVLKRTDQTTLLAGDAGIPGIASVEFIQETMLVPPVGSHALVLTHGYCVGENTWTMSQFSSDAYKYENPNQNNSHDTFALDIASRASQFKSYGLIGHSQGGCAALHLYTFYWSGLDWAGPGRIIQTLGTPFKGSGIAGNLAALGEIFGVQCGANNDMTYAGAAAWLSTIPTSARAKVFSHTTTFTDNWFGNDYCNFFTDLFLTDPEDGVTENSSGHITGGNNMGLKSGWCHTAGMRDPNQCTDSQRNAVLNSQGAR